ncbi:MAG: cystathionine gamma-synthase [Neisseriaceae bacterium]|nr:cystathionine gamma-synthase [Neisseriaceae bacterium]MBP6861605.1 cystathionine gamma-synthase [Neisseriaceae bacterium]
MSFQIATLAIRSGLNDDDQYGAVVPPLHLSSTYNFKAFKEPRTHDYARRGNPSRDHSIHALAQLEGGAGAILTNSGTSALLLLLTVFLTPDDLLLAPHDCYGGSYRLLTSLSQQGAFKVCFVNQGNEAELQQALAQKPKLVLIETPSNPLLNVVDIQRLCQGAHSVGALAVVDNTFLSPVLQRPFELGADLVLHSCTKYLNGHSDVVAGAVVCATDALTESLTWWANNLGVTCGAFDSYLLLRGLRTLVPRVQQQQRNAEAIVAFLVTQPLVDKVYYPGLSTHPGHAIAQRQQRGFGAMVSLELKGCEAQLAQFLAQLQLFTLAESLGGVESLIAHPASMTHAGMSPEAQQQAGISAQLLRLSVGLEDAADLIADLAQALAATATA